MRFIMAGGGTGGHLFPGIALAEAIQSLAPAAVVSFVGTRTGMDSDIVPRAGYCLDQIAAGRGSPLQLRRPMNLPRFAIACWQALLLLRRERPQAVIALGGYAAAAPGIAARILGIPLVVLEQNTVPGRVNRMLAGWARQIHLQFRAARERFGSTSATWFDSGSPMRSSIAQLAMQPPCKGDALLIMGGSQGAQSMNDLVIGAIPAIVKACGCKVIHLAGARNEKAVAEAYHRVGIQATVFGFSDQVEGCYRRARLAISRAGAGSLAELAVAGIPAVLLPLASSKDDHQRLNAEVIAGQHGAVVFDEMTVTSDDLAQSVVGIWNDEKKRAGMADAIRRTARAGAAEEIARYVISLAGRE